MVTAEVKQLLGNVLLADNATVILFHRLLGCLIFLFERGITVQNYTYDGIKNRINSENVYYQLN
jgi:hypothetical protein